MAPMHPDVAARLCPSCEADPKAAPKRTCPGGRCYCGHADCPAYASWKPLPDRRGHIDNVTPLHRPDRRAS